MPTSKVLASPREAKCAKTFTFQERTKTDVFRNFQEEGTLFYRSVPKSTGPRAHCVGMARGLPGEEMSLCPAVEEKGQRWPLCPQENVSAHPLDSVLSRVWVRLTLSDGVSNA